MLKKRDRKPPPVNGVSDVELQRRRNVNWETYKVAERERMRKINRRSSQ